MSKFVYRGKDKTFARRMGFADGGTVDAGTYKLTKVDDSTNSNIATAGTFGTTTSPSSSTAPVSTTPTTASPTSTGSAAIGSATSTSPSVGSKI